MNENIKNKISKSRIKFLKANPDKHPWKNKEKFISKPCEHLKQLLKDKNYTFEEEFTDARWNHCYSLDIAFLDKKLAIEVNGNQHYKNDGTLTDYYQNRHDYLTSQGWNVLEIHYTWCYKDDKIQEIVKAIENSIEIDLTEHELLFTYKRKTLEERNKEKEQIKRKNKEKNKEKRKDELEKRKFQILNSDVDLTKYGWIKKVEYKTGLTRRQIYKLVNKTNLKEIVFRRSS